MAINKNALIRFQTLDRCFRNPGKRYFYEDLIEEVNKSLANVGSDGIGKSQLYKDIRFMESNPDWDIEILKLKDGAKVYRRYRDLNSSINQSTYLNQVEAEKLKNAFSVLNKFRGLPQFGWINEIIPKIDSAFNISEKGTEIISFDNNEYLKGLEFIDPLFNAILYKNVIEISYHSFKNPEPVVKIISAYHLKEYNNRWYVYGEDMEYANIVNLALDRIIDFKLRTDIVYKETDINFEEYFEDTLGVTFQPGEDTEVIILKIDNSLWPYIDTKPIHGSQKVVSKDENTVTIELELIPNYELESQILHFGEMLEVLEPSSLRIKIKNRVEALSRKYN